MKNRILIISASLLLSLIMVAGGVYYGYRLVIEYGKTPLQITTAQQFELKKGRSFRQTIGALQKRGIIEDNWKLKLFIKLHPEFVNIRSGYYQITPKDTAFTMLDKFNRGKEMVFSVTLVEGQTIEQWRELLKSLPRLDWKDGVFNQVLLAHGDQSGLPEGKFYPDTYYYTAETKINHIIEQSYTKMQQQLKKAWQTRDTKIPLESPYQLLILASIIEKETGQAQERPVIAAVFTNRLKLGMRLQTDPTVIYGMGDDYNGNITRQDLRNFTTFNTYRINGLTPTPIAAPGGASLRAAAHPAAVDYLYFVSNNKGGHIFSKTLKEHNRAVNKYQKLQSNR